MRFKKERERDTAREYKNEKTGLITKTWKQPIKTH